MKNEENKNEKNIENLNEEIIQKYKNLYFLRIELNSHKTILLYYKQYPKKESKKYPQNLTAIFFYFDEELDEKFFYLYISLIGQIDRVDLGSFFNRKGSKNKRKIVKFAIIKFIEEESLNNLMNQYKTQLLINEYLEKIRNKDIDINYDPLKEENELNIIDEPDKDGFIEVKSNTRKNNFSNKNISFKIVNDKFDEYDNLYKRRRKRKRNEMFYNFQIVDKKKEMYEQLKNLFEEDKKIINNKKQKN